MQSAAVVKRLPVVRREDVYQIGNNLTSTIRQILGSL